MSTLWKEPLPSKFDEVEDTHAFTRTPIESMEAMVEQGLAFFDEDGEFCMLLQADQITEGGKI